MAKTVRRPVLRRDADMLRRLREVEEMARESPSLSWILAGSRGYAGPARPAKDRSANRGALTRK